MTNTFKGRSLVCSTKNLTPITPNTLAISCKSINTVVVHWGNTTFASSLRKHATLYMHMRIYQSRNHVSAIKFYDTCLVTYGMVRISDQCYSILFIATSTSRSISPERTLTNLPSHKTVSAFSMPIEVLTKRSLSRVVSFYPG